MALDFPAHAAWSTTVVHPDDGHFCKRRFYDYYIVKYLIARACRPTAIAEIGVRYGYSAWSFLRAAPTASYVGFDLQAGTEGGVKGVNTFGYVSALLAKDYPCAPIELREVDTRRLTDLGGPYDFIHVDGDHKEAGCLADVDMALTACRPGGIVLVDDDTYIEAVHCAVETACKQFADRIALAVHVASLRGERLLIRK